MLPELIFDWARRTPERTAIYFHERRVSYRDFAQAIAILRGFFARHGYVGPGTAAIAFDNMLDFWTFTLALRSLGLTTVAVPDAKTLAALPLADLRCVVRNTKERWEGLEGVCAKRGIPLVDVSLESETPLGLDAFAAPAPPGGHILLTSGTTGGTRMVLMTPAIDALFLRRKAELIGMDRNTVLCVFSFGGWTGVGYRWAASPWTVGGATLIEHGSRRHRALLRPGITHAVITPAALDAVLAVSGDELPRNDSLMLAVGGGPMTRNHVTAVNARLTSRLFNFLASTESGGMALTPIRTADDHRWHQLAPGRAIEIVDEGGRPVPPGVTGRLRIGTEGGPKGYLHNDAATREFFRDGYFYPGDLAVFREDGRMALQGRVTDVINLRGTKVSPGPIEDRLCEALGVRGICLFSMQDENGEEQIHMIVEAADAVDTGLLAPLLRGELRGFTRAHLHYAAELPRNHMGKLLRNAAREQALAASRSSTVVFAAADLPE